MLQEIRFAIRSLAKSPAFVVIAIATLALAIGANSAVFSLINALLVRPLPYQQPSKLALIWEQFAAQGLDRIPVFASGISRSGEGIPKRDRDRGIYLSNI